MGNVQSAAASRPHYNNLIASEPASRIHLDYDNMPFLKLPDDQSPSGSDGYTTPEKMSHSPQSSYTPISPSSLQSEWYQGHAKWPSYHHQAEKSCVPGMQGEISAIATSESDSSTNRSPSSSQSGSSIVSQLSFLSQVCPRGGSQRHSFRSSISSPRTSISILEVDANVPPEVPPHKIFPVKSTDSETQVALAAVEALECEVEEDGRLSRRPSRRLSQGSPKRSRSRSRSVHRPRSLSSTRIPCLSPDNDLPLTTDVYTRKCSSPELPTLCRSTGEHNDDDDSDSDAVEPRSPEKLPFALDGYNDGTTKLRVVNYDSNPQSASYTLPSPISFEKSKPRHKPEKYRIKSKAQLAEEEEDLLRKRYARYGHCFKGANAYRSEEHGITARHNMPPEDDLQLGFACATAQ